MKWTTWWNVMWLYHNISSLSDHNKSKAVVTGSCNGSELTLRLIPHRLYWGKIREPGWTWEELDMMQAVHKCVNKYCLGHWYRVRNADAAPLSLNHYQRWPAVIPYDSRHHDARSNAELRFITDESRTFVFVTFCLYCRCICHGVLQCVVHNTTILPWWSLYEAARAFTTCVGSFMCSLSSTLGNCLICQQLHNRPRENISPIWALSNWWLDLPAQTHRWSAHTKSDCSEHLSK